MSGEEQLMQEMQNNTICFNSLVSGGAALILNQ